MWPPGSLPMPKEETIYQFTTAANLAGIDALKKGMLGLNVEVVGLATVLFAVYEVGKSGIENYRAQESALGSLRQAVDAYNASLGKVIPVSEEALSALVSATEAAANADDSLTFAQDAVTIAQINYSQAVEKHGATSAEATKASIHLKDANIHLTNAQETAKETTDDLARAEAVKATVVEGSAISLDHLHDRVKEFIRTNAGYIKNQYDVEQAAAASVRAFNDEDTSMRILNDALDMSVIKHENVTDAEKQIELAFMGNKKALKEVGISTEEFDAIMQSKTLTTAQKHAALLDLIESHYAKGRDLIDETEQKQNKLTIEWQKFTTKVGPDLLLMWDKLNEAMATGLGILSVTVDLLDKLGKIGAAGAAWAAPKNYAPRGGSALPSGAYQPGAQGLTEPVPVGRTTGTQSFDSGGTVQGDYEGQQVMVQAKVGEHFSMGDNGSGPRELHIHIDQGAYIDGPSIDRLANLILQRARYAPGL